MPSLDGKLQLVTDTIVALPVTIKNVHVNKLDDGKFRAILGDIQYTAKNADDAMKGWKSAYKKSIVAKRTKKKKAEKAGDRAAKENAAKEAAAVTK
jgi:hypothetical protein